MELHDLLATRFPSAVGFTAAHAMKIVSGITQKSVGLDMSGLLNVDHAMYRVMVPSRDGYIGGAPPIFQSLANGQTAYVYLLGRPDDSDHMTRLFTGLPPATLQQLGPGNDDLSQVRQTLLNRMQSGEFPAYISADGNLQQMSGTDSIATESISSIATRQNVMSCDFSDPSSYYKWLVTRVDSAFRRVDPWLWAVNLPLHNAIASVKTTLTPNWVSNANSKDLLGFIPNRSQTATAYNTVMGILGNGQRPTYDTLAAFADTAISMDRDLEVAVQTYWIKLLREISPAQRQSLFVPLARTWVALNVVPPTDPNFSKVSPDNAPYIELIDKANGDAVLERYDRAVAMGEVVDHTLDGLGYAHRQQLLDTTMAEVRANADAINAREARLRAALGDAYSGLDVDGILNDRVDANDPKVKAALEQLHSTIGTDSAVHPMTPLHADELHHLTLMQWAASRNIRYGEAALTLAEKLPLKPNEPLLVGEFWRPVDALPPSQLPAGPTSQLILGKPRPGVAPLNASVLLEGGGGLGFAYAQCLNQTSAALDAADGQVAIDEFIGTSAGALTAVIPACGYRFSELPGVQQQLDFKQFYADYLWLAGASDPQIRGVDRSGMFSTRQMYQTMRDLIGQKVKVDGRPVLFRDLPFKLKVVSTVVNTDLPDDLKKQLGIGPDGQIVFSAENTPNMDVAAAVCASASLPTFFQAPQIAVVRPEVDANGQKRLATYRLQLIDGGTVNNFAASTATDFGDARSLLTVLPAYDQAPGANPGDPPVSLSVLNFDTAALKQIDAYNAQRYAQFGPQLANFFQKARGDGCTRAIIGYHPADISAQTAPLVQGHTRGDSKHLRQLADQVGLGTLDVKTAANLVRSFYPSHHYYAEQLLIDKLLDTDGTFKTSFFHGPSYNIGRNEATGIGDIMIATVAANVTASAHLDGKLFERS